MPSGVMQQALRTLLWTAPLKSPGSTSLPGLFAFSQPNWCALLPSEALAIETADTRQ
jgi:hypothetical protein